ncbi:MAG: beta-ketoacyl-[acyl-carrier-protein] synthase II [Cystobacterineae bacterium]|nr:beta-ketoacyl-[acyl-carrier-protein] synthase II [Cystobacterineae bacterium]
MSFQPIFLSKPGLICCAGQAFEPFFEAAVRGDQSGILPTTLHVGAKTHSFLVGRAPTPPPEAATKLLFLCTTALQQLRPTAEKALQRFGPQRVGLCLGSCDNGTEDSLPAHRSFFERGAWPQGYQLSLQSAARPAEYAARFLGLEGPVFSLATACASSASAIARGAELIAFGLCDAVVAGGVDIASEASLLGFWALEALSAEHSNPFSKNRKGINLGEGAAFFVLSREKLEEEAMVLAGYGESADAFHMTAPHPEGIGAAAAMQAALHHAGISPTEVAYVNLHGTGTRLNDSAEAKAMHAVFGKGQPPASSTKAVIGHTLGAAGALELALCWGVLHTGTLPPHCWDGVVDETLPALHLVKAQERLPAEKTHFRKARYCMNNSFAFGGCNLSLLMRRAEEL